MKEELVCRLKCSFEIRAARGDDVGRERFAVLCKMLLIVFQRAPGLDEEDWTTEA